MEPQRGRGPINALDREFLRAHSKGYLLLTRSNSLITWSVRSIVSLL
jgi:hypothetical protein